MADEMVAEIDAKLFSTIRMVHVARWVLIGLGGFISLVFGFLHYYKKQNRLISPTLSANTKAQEKNKF